MDRAKLLALIASSLAACEALNLKANADGVLAAADQAEYDNHWKAHNDAKASLAEADRLKAAADERKAALAKASAGQPRTAPPAGGSRIEVLGNPALEANAGFKSPRDFFSAVMRSGQGIATDNRLAPLRAAVGSDEQTGGSNPHGGFLIPAGFLPSLLSVSQELDPTASLVTRLPMTAPRVDIPARVDKNHTSSVTGGLRVYRRSEAAAATASRMSMEQVSLTAFSLMGLSFTTNELMNDSPITVAALIESGFREELAANYLDEKLNGTGVGGPKGVIGDDGSVSVAKESGQTAQTIVYQNILKMRSRCWGYGRAVWLANHETLPQLAQLSLSVGTGGLPVWMPSAGGDVPDLLMGRPIYFTEFCPALGTVGDIVCGNWSQYLWGTLGTETFAESMHVRFDSNETAFRIEARNDGRNWWRSALTPKRGTNTLAPFVTLATRA